MQKKKNYLHYIFYAILFNNFAFVLKITYNKLLQNNFFFQVIYCFFICKNEMSLYFCFIRMCIRANYSKCIEMNAASFIFFAYAIYLHF